MKRLWVPLVSGVLAVSQTAQAAPEIRTYVVQPGDSVWSIAEEFYGSGNKYPLIYKHNNFIGQKPPFLLKVGQELQLPLENQRPEAQVQSMKRNVRAKPPRSADWLNAREQMSLWRLYRVSTGDESAAHIVFDDKSDVRLRENALLVIYGASATTAQTARRDKREVMLEQGTISGGLAALDGASKGLIVKTNSGEVDILGTSTQVQSNSLETLVSVFQGYAAVTAQGETVSVPEGQGTRVEKGKKPEAPRPLPKAPEWVEGSEKALVASLSGQPVSWEAKWKSVPEAKGYRVELASDPEFNHILYDVEVDASVQRVRLADLKPGHYFVRLATKDKVGLESAPSKPLPVSVVTILSARALEANNSQAIEGFGMAALKLDESTPSDIYFEYKGRQVRDLYILDPGTHEVALVQAGMRSTFLVNVSPALAELAHQRDEATGQWVITAATRDAKGNLKTLPGLKLELQSADGTTRELAMQDLGPGQSRATYLPEEAWADWAVRLSWPGGELATLRQEGEAKLVTLPEGYRNPHLISPRPLRRGLAQLAQTPLLETRLGLDLSLAARTFEGEDTWELGTTLQGAWRLGAVELNADLGLNHTRWSGIEPEGRMGDVGLGLKVALAEGHNEGLSLGLRLGLPLGDGHEAPLTLEEGLNPRIFSGELHLLGRKRLGEALFVDANVGVLAGNDFDESSLLNLSARLGLGWQVTQAWWLNLSGELVAGLEREFWGQLYGVGTGFAIEGVRLGLGFGLSFDEDSKASLGQYFGRLTFDFSLPSGR